MPNIGSICNGIQPSLKFKSVKLQSDRMWEQLYDVRVLYRQHCIFNLPFATTLRTLENNIIVCDCAIFI